MRTKPPQSLSAHHRWEEIPNQGDQWHFHGASKWRNWVRSIALIVITVTIPITLIVALLSVQYLNEPVQVVDGVVIESSRPLEGEVVKAPVDVDGDGSADAWAFGEFLPGDRATVLFDAAGQSIPPRDHSHMWIGVAVAAIIALFLIVLASMFLHEINHGRRGISRSDWDEAHSLVVSQTPPREPMLLPPPVTRLHVSRWRLGARLRHLGLTPWGTRYRLFAAVSHRTSRARLALLLLHPMPWVAAAAAGNPRTPIWVLRLALRARRRGRRALLTRRLPARDIDWVAAQPGTPIEVLLVCATHPGVSPETSERFAQHPDLVLDQVSGAVRRMDTSADMLAALTNRLLTGEVMSRHVDSYSSAEECLHSIARHPNTPTSTLGDILHATDDTRTIQAIAQHANTDPGEAMLAALRAPASQSARFHYETPHGH